MTTVLTVEEIGGPNISINTTIIVSTYRIDFHAIDSFFLHSRLFREIYTVILQISVRRCKRLSASFISSHTYIYLAESFEKRNFPFARQIWQF